MKIRFPDPSLSDEHGIVYVGGELSEENVLAAYEAGIFPWPHEGMPLLWFSPQARGVLDIADFHVPRSTAKELRKKKFRITFDTQFSEVIRHCAEQKRQGQGGSWITPELMETYGKLHRWGYAHSVECWSEDNLVGGLYGVYICGVFSGESMFFKESGASKACLMALVEKLRELGHTWLDIQMVTPILEMFGGKYIHRDKYLSRLKSTQAQKIVWK